MRDAELHRDRDQPEQQLGASTSLGLTSSTDPTAALGNNNPGVVVTGEHSGLANLVPGNPGTVDPPAFDAATPSSTGGTLGAGSYTYAITDQFSATGGESSASTTTVTVPTGATAGSVALSWEAVCHAADYKIYREVTGSNAWTLVTTDDRHERRFHRYRAEHPVLHGHRRRSGGHRLDAADEQRGHGDAVPAERESDHRLHDLGDHRVRN